MTDSPATSPTDFTDLTALSCASATLERVLNRWVAEFEQVGGTPDIPTLCEAIDYLSRLTAVRKTIIKLSRLTPDVGVPVRSSNFSLPGHPTPDHPHSDHANGLGVQASACPTSLPASPGPLSPLGPLGPLRPLSPLTPQLPAVTLSPVAPLRALPLSALAPELAAIANDLTHSIAVNGTRSTNDFATEQISQIGSITTPSTDDDPEPKFGSRYRPSSASRDIRCVALNIHPYGDTAKFPDHHPSFDRANYGSFNKALRPWHRKPKPKRFT